MTPVIHGFILVIPAKAGIHTDSPPELYCPLPPGLVIPEKAETHCWRWIPAFAGMTTSIPEGHPVTADGGFCVSPVAIGWL
ncbi:hypothetical protein [Endozoicomonas sp. ALC020]|uniref:hypothetical protein n=1 Tax=unclassified Endozoicomonas TaxID=2644528 RepID=UPI003BAFFB2A